MRPKDRNSLRRRNEVFFSFNRYTLLLSVSFVGSGGEGQSQVGIEIGLELKIHDILKLFASYEYPMIEN
jgi:hypothetical protein